MKKGYIIASVTVANSEVYAHYAAASAEALKLHNGRALVRAGAQVTLEGFASPRTVVLEFESYARAQEYYRSVEYQTAKALREGSAIANIIAVEGAE